ncbi:sensor histidine kinase [Sinomonas sp. P10A9]|uniref:Oxygen sensor histidine kinase NreB n=1 Tax=Sinomonas puerhi TaxID=3238584 RepID=A0AB39L4S1_9MICC
MAANAVDATTTSTEQVLRWLRVALHVGFAALLLVGTVRSVLPSPSLAGTTTDGAMRAPAPLGVVLPAAALLAAVYLAGTVAEKRHAQGATFDPARYVLPWLGVVCGLWLVLVASSAEFAWVAFALFFLQLHLLARWWGVIAVVVTAELVVLALWRHGGGGPIAPATLLGPLFGAAFAVVTSFAYRALYTEAEAQRAAADELRRTRAALAESQHRAGVLAERERLAREIHDTLAQGFSSIVLMGRSVAKALDEGDAPAARERLGIVQATAADSLAEARAFVRGLSSPALAPAAGERGDAGPGVSTPLNPRGRLPDALRGLCVRTAAESSARGNGLECRFDLDGEPRPLTTAAEEVLLRAAQASLANVWAHAAARTAVVSLAYLDGEVMLDVFDDGAGFDPAALPEAPRPDGTGYGLRGLRERVEGIGGTLAIESAPGEGTVVAVRLPAPGGGVFGAAGTGQGDA